MLGLLKTLAFTSAIRQGAAGVKRKFRQAVICALAAACGALILLVGIGFLIAFGHQALASATDDQTANLVFGVAFAALGAITIAAGKAALHSDSRRGILAPEIPERSIDAGSPGSDLGRDIERLLSRNAGTLATGAFVAGLLLATRRR